MFNALQLFGGILLAIGYIPQLRKMLRTKSADDFHIQTYLMLFIGIACMEAYAVSLAVNGTGVMFLITNTLSLLITGIMTVTIYVLQRRENHAHRNYKKN